MTSFTADPIPPLDEQAQQSAAARQKRLTKPEGALGKLETLSIRLCAMRSTPEAFPTHPAVIVFAADHGVARRGVSAYPQDVTRQMVLNFLRGGAAVNVLARQMNARVLVVDAGVIGTFEDDPALVQGKIARATADFTQERAMTSDQAVAALVLGQRVAKQIIGEGVDLLAVGEMGIGNTTSASAIIAALTGASVASVTGRGTGIDDSMLARKVALIEDALTLHAPAASSVLEKIGGFEIGAMAGAMLATAAFRVPVVLDGVISAAAALVAVQIMPAVRDYLIAGHCGIEPGHRIALDYLGLDPLLELGLRLGEGTGALLALPLIEAALRTLHEMATFEDAGVSERKENTTMSEDRP